MQKQVMKQKTRPTTLDQAWQTGEYLTWPGSELNPEHQGLQDTHTEQSHFPTCSEPEILGIHSEQGIPPTLAEVPARGYRCFLSFALTSASIPCPMRHPSPSDFHILSDCWVLSKVQHLRDPDHANQQLWP